MSAPRQTTTAQARDGQSARFDFARAASLLTDAACRAGAAIMEHFRTVPAVEIKGDMSPVTHADHDSNKRLQTRIPPKDGLTALVSRSHLDPETETFLAKLKIASRSAAGSSVKFLSIAKGEADVYPRFGPTMEWDTAAGQAVLEAAGGVVVDANGAPLRYGKTESGLRNHGFIAWGLKDADPAHYALK